MKIVNYTDFRSNMAETLNMVNDDGDIVIVSRPKGKNVVVMSMEEYNSQQETLHLLSSKANRDRLDQAIGEMKKGKFIKKKLVE